MAPEVTPERPHAERQDDPEVERVKAVLESRLLGGSQVSTRIGRFVVLERVGAGGMGVVFSAFDPQLDRKVAIKLLFEGESDERERARLLGEAKALAKLAHPNVVGVYEVGEHLGRVFIAMEYVGGRTLKRWVAETPRKWREALAMCVQAGRGLAAAHAAGIVHRDFKPDNVLVGDDDRPRVLDFGLARQTMDEGTDRGDSGAIDSANDNSLTKLTRTGAFVGTPAYMAPEQFRREAIDARADQFSFCVATWEALYGERPFVGETFAKLSDEVQAGRIRTLPQVATVPNRVRTILERGLRRSPEQRWPDMTTLIDALTRAIATRRVWLAALAMVALIAASVATASWFVRKPAACAPADERLAAVWNDDTRTRVRAALGADVDGDAVEAKLGGWTAAWEQAYTANCARLDDGDRDGEADVRNTCLEWRLDELGARVDVIGDLGPGGAADLGVDVLAGLHHPRLCEPAFALASAPPPTDPVLRDAVRSLHLEANRLAPMVQVGRYDEAIVAGEALRVRAHELQWNPVTAHVLTQLGRAYLRREQHGDDPRAEQLLRDALSSATASGDRLLVIESSITLAEVLSERLGQSRRARDYLERARAELAHLGSDTDFEAKIEGVLTDVTFLEGDLEAVARHARAGDQPEDAVLALAMLGRFDEALEFADAALESGVDDGHCEFWDRNRALVAVGRGEVESARELFDGARRTTRRGMTKHDIDVDQLMLEGRVGDACAVLDELTHLAAVYKREGYPEYPWDQWGCLYTLPAQPADLQLACGRLEAAEQGYRERVAACERTLGARHRGLMPHLTGIGRVLLARGDAAGALVVLERALALLPNGSGPPANDASTRFAGARALWETGGDRARARSLATEALAGYSALAEGFEPERRAVETWLQTHL